MPTATPGRRSATLSPKQVSADWQTLTITKIIPETPQVKTFWLEAPQRWPILPGQHLELRLTAANGYQASRDYSIANSPLESGLAITVQMIPGGEVSGYLDQQAKVGDQLDLRYPIGYHFIWSDSLTQPVLLLAGGSGIVPLASMLRHHQLSGATTPMRLLYSARRLEDVIYRSWLMSLEANQPSRHVAFTLTDQTPPDWSGYNRRIDAAMLSQFTAGLELDQLLVYVCGPTLMVEAVSQAAQGLGIAPDHIKTERFGPTGK